MKSPGSDKGIYFEGDIGMSASALIEMFGNDAHARVSERLKEVEQDGSEGAKAFWQAVVDEISQRLKSGKS